MDVCSQVSITTVIARSIAMRCDVAISWYNKAIADAEYSMNSTRMVSFIGHLSSCYCLPGDCHVASHSDAPRNDSGYRYLSASILLLM